jgi:hypothetical protein
VALGDRVDPGIRRATERVEQMVVENADVDVEVKA